MSYMCHYLCHVFVDTFHLLLILHISCQSYI